MKKYDVHVRFPGGKVVDLVVDAESAETVRAELEGACEKITVTPQCPDRPLRRVVLFSNGEIRLDGRFIQERVINDNGEWWLIRGGYGEDRRQRLDDVTHIHDDREKIQERILQLAENMGFGVKRHWGTAEVARELKITMARVQQAQKLLDLGERIGNTWIFRADDIEAIRERIGKSGKKLNREGED